MADRSPRAVLNHLIETCRDAERGFRQAADLVSDPSLKALFSDIADERAEFANDLVPHANRLGGEATAAGTAAGSLHRWWMDIRDRLSGHDDLAVVAEVRRGDNVTRLAFKSAVDGVLPMTVRELLDQQYAQICAEHARIESLDRSETLET